MSWQPISAQIHVSPVQNGDHHVTKNSAVFVCLLERYLSMTSLSAYLSQMLRAEWIRSFFFAKTKPLTKPAYFLDYPIDTGKRCTHCFSCMMICPAPDAISVIIIGDTDGDDVWKPVVYQGHCLRCGLCVEICPEGVLASGDIIERVRHDSTYMQATFHILVNEGKCVGCGTCSIACPVNREIDPVLASKGTTTSDEVIMRVKAGVMRVLHEEKCTGCKTCALHCSYQAMNVARVLECLQYESECETSGG